MPTLSGMLTIDRSEFTAAMRKHLTIKLYDHTADTYTTVKVYSVSGNTVSIPRQYGLTLLGDKEYIDNTSAGKEVSFPKRIQLYDYQKPFVDDLLAEYEVAYDAVAQAATGKGKTIMSLEVIRRIGVTAIVLVDQEFLRDQWISSAKKFLGLSGKDIGLVQGKVCDYKGKKLVVAMVQSLYKKDYNKDFYSYFGTVVFDEQHTVGAEKFSRVLSLFPAAFRFGVSATPERTDALQRVLDAHLGKVSVRLEAKHKISQVRYVEYDGVLSWYANISPKTGRYIAELTSDTLRNDLLSDIIVKMYNGGRHVLAVSDRIEHLDNLKALCIYKGVPEKDIGVVAGYSTVWKYAKDATPGSKPQYLENGAEYTPVCIQRAKIRIPSKELAKRKETKQVILATYGMFTKGVDVPRLSAGIDCTPRSKAKQVHGRILRDGYRGKKTPIWVTIRDRMSYKADYQFSKRIPEYIESNSEIMQWDLSKGVRKVDHVKLLSRVKANIKRLKAARILTQRDGSNIVVT